MAQSYKLPIIPSLSVKSSRDFDTPTRMEYDEVIFDYKTNRYLTLSQEQEIYKLKDELKKQQEEKSRKLKNIIGYYYKR